PGASTLTVIRFPGLTHSVPMLSRVTSTTWASACLPEPRRSVVEAALVSLTAEPGTAGCRVSAKTCRLLTSGAGACVVGSVIEVAVRVGSIHSSVGWMCTGCWSTPDGLYRYGAPSDVAPPLYQSGADRV